MTKQLTFNMGKAIAVLVFLCLAMLQACRKDILAPNSKGIQQSLSIEEAKKYFEANFKKSGVSNRLMSTGGTGVKSEQTQLDELFTSSKKAVWESAYQTLMSTGAAVKVPLDFGKAYVVTDAAKKELIPFGALNYLYMYKDSLEKIHTEWVILSPDKAWLHGKRDEYTGRVIVKDWEGRTIRSFEKKGTSTTPKKTSFIKLANGDMPPPIDPPLNPPIEPPDETVWLICVTVCHDFCDETIVDGRKCWIVREQNGGGDGWGGTGGTGGSGGSGGNGPSSGGPTNGGGGGRLVPSDYFPPSGRQCDPDPNYQIPNYPAPSGYDWIMPCTMPGAIPLPSDPNFNPDDDSENWEPETLPENLEITYSHEWFDIEDNLAIIGADLIAAGLQHTDPIPESYYIFGTGIDMTHANKIKGYTVFGAPRSHTYFWTELYKKRPEMFSNTNLDHIKRGGSPFVDEQWLTYNPTHRAYNKAKLIHHHHLQRNMAYALPEPVHFKWNRILHEYRQTGKINRIGGKLNSIAGILEVFRSLVDIHTGNPDAWINWFGSQNELGKLYKDNANNVYWKMIKKTETRNGAGVVVKAVVTYEVYEDYIWDDDENRYFGFPKLGTFTEEIDVINQRTINRNFQMI